jgi:stearoyl-CoA desaturase (delta-9 desaturase)
MTQAILHVTPTISRNVLAVARPRRAIATLSTVQATILGATHALALAALFMPSRAGAIGFVVAYVLTGYGISLGYHRGLSHGAFRAPALTQFVLYTLGALAFQGGPITWVGFHRAHHRFTDEPGDPHAASRGFFWSHIGWALHKGPNGYRPQKLRHLTASLKRVPLLRALERWNVALNLSLFVLTWMAFGASVALWVFPLRIVALWHVTWCTNSVAHRAGQAVPAPRNVGWLALVGFGEGLHANHHDAPSDARFARSRREMDPGYWGLALLAFAGLVHLPKRRSTSRLALQPNQTPFQMTASAP